MSHTSPASFLVWSIFSCILGGFLLYHLWSFDKFKCLKWNNGPYAGAFKRVMTYTYLLTVPLVITFSLGFTIIKYLEGYSLVPGHGIIPTPFQLWSPTSRAAIFPLMMTFSVGWSLEMVTHLEELCFWLFLVNAGSAQQDWFRSLYFKTWVIGSCVAVTYMPLVTIFTRNDPLKSEAYTFLAGSMGSLSLTIWFTPILWTFPSFLESLREENVDANTIVRLTKFHELNTIRILFRFLFTVPLFILGVDGVRSHQHVNESALWTDFLAMIAGFGCVTSSGITLVIFFPRSIEGEIAARDHRRGRSKMGTMQTTTHGSMNSQHSLSFSIDGGINATSGARSYLMDNTAENDKPRYEMTQTSRPAPTRQDTLLNQTTDWSQSPHEHYQTLPRPLHHNGRSWTADGDNVPDPADDSEPQITPEMPLRPNRRVNNVVEMGVNLQHPNPSRDNSDSASKMSSARVPIHHMVHNFRSPIDLVSGGGRRNNLEFPNNGSRLTFTRS